MKANLVAAVLAAAVTMVAPAAGHSRQAAAVARVRWHIPATATLKEPIVATVEIGNLSDDTINIDLGIDEKTMFSLHEIRAFSVDAAFGTLVRIGTPEAKSAVEQMAKSKDRQLAQKAKSVLPQFAK